MDKQLRNLFVTEEAIKKYRDDFKEDEKFFKETENIIDIIYNKIHKYLILDLDIINYMVITYSCAKKEKKKFRMNDKMKQVLNNVKEVKKNDNKKGKEAVIEAVIYDKATLNNFPVDIKEEMIDWCQESLKNLINLDNLNMFDTREGKKTIKIFGFNKTQKILDKIKEDEDNESMIRNIIFLDYVLGITLTQKIYLCTDKIKSKLELGKINKIIQLLNRIPCLNVRYSIVEDIIKYISYNDDSYVMKERGIIEFNNKKIKEIENRLEKIVDELECYCWYKIQNEIIMWFDSSEEQKKEYQKNLRDKILENYNKNELIYIDIYENKQWEILCNFLNLRHYQKLDKKITWEDYEMLKLMGKRENTLDDVELITTRREIKHKIEGLSIMDYLWFGEIVPDGLNIAQENEWKIQTMKEKLKLEEEELNNRLKELRNSIRKTEDTVLKYFDKLDIKENEREMQEYQRYAIIHKEIMKNIAKNFSGEL